MVKLFRIRRYFTPKEKLNIIFSTYGSLTKFNQKKLGPSAVARQCNLLQPTVSKLIKRFEQQGFNTDKFALEKKHLGMRRVLIGSETIEKELLSTECLTNWVHMSIIKRCEKIKKIYKVEVKRERLRRFYKRNSISCRSAHTNLYPHGHNLALLKAQRIEFADKLAQYIVDGVPILYYDHTTFNAWQF